MPIPPRILNRCTTAELADALAARLAEETKRSLETARDVQAAYQENEAAQKAFPALPEQFAQLIKDAEPYQAALQRMVAESASFTVTMQTVGQLGAQARARLDAFRREVAPLLAAVQRAPRG